MKSGEIQRINELLKRSKIAFSKAHLAVFNAGRSCEDLAKAMRLVGIELNRQRKRERSKWKSRNNKKRRRPMG